jgi:hypothetical protein
VQESAGVNPWPVVSMFENGEVIQLDASNEAFGKLTSNFGEMCREAASFCFEKHGSLDE